MPSLQRLAGCRLRRPNPGSVVAVRRQRHARAERSRCYPSSGVVAMRPQRGVLNAARWRDQVEGHCFLRGAAASGVDAIGRLRRRLASATRRGVMERQLFLPGGWGWVANIPQLRQGSAAARRPDRAADRCCGRPVQLLRGVGKAGNRVSMRRLAMNPRSKGSACCLQKGTRKNRCTTTERCNIFF